MAPTRTAWEETRVVTAIDLSFCLFRVLDNALTPIRQKILFNSLFRWKKIKTRFETFEDRPKTGRRSGVFGLGYKTSGCQKASEWDCSHLVRLVKWFSFLIHNSWPLRMMKRRKRRKVQEEDWRWANTMWNISARWCHKTLWSGLTESCDLWI